MNTASQPMMFARRRVSIPSALQVMPSRLRNPLPTWARTLANVGPSMIPTRPMLLAAITGNASSERLAPPSLLTPHGV